MNRHSAERLARQLMNEHGLVGWSFGWNTRKKGCGLCIHTRREIQLSAHYVAMNPEDNVRDTILHEIAHALVGGNHGHDRVWRAKAISIGCSGERCADESTEMPEGSWQPVCHKGHESSTRFHRAPLRVRSCSKCSPRGFAPEHVMTWQKDGRKVPLGSMPKRYVTEVISMRERYGARLAVWESFSKGIDQLNQMG